MNSELSLQTWEKLIKLTSENISEEQLNHLLQDLLHVEKVKDLTESQAQELTKALSPLVNFRQLVWESIVNGITKKQSLIEKPLSNVEATNVADAGTPEVLDRIAELFVKKYVNLDLFNKPPAPPPTV